MASGTPMAVQDSSPPSPLKGILASGLPFLLAALLAGCTVPYAPQEFDFGAQAELDHAVFGVVESVREVQLGADPSGIAEALVHSVES